MSLIDTTNTANATNIYTDKYCHQQYKQYLHLNKSFKQKGYVTHGDISDDSDIRFKCLDCIKYNENAKNIFKNIAENKIGKKIKYRESYVPFSPNIFSDILNLNLRLKLLEVRTIDDASNYLSPNIYTYLL
jgi:hypothetical protein